MAYYLVSDGTKCPKCGSNSTTVFSKPTNYPEREEFLKCYKCGKVTSYGIYNPDKYRKKYSGGGESNNKGSMLEGAGCGAAIGGIIGFIAGCVSCIKASESASISDFSPFVLLAIFFRILFFAILGGVTLGIIVGSFKKN